MAVVKSNSKVELADGTVLIDLTSDSVTAAHLEQGYTAHNAAGKKITGKLVAGASSVDVYNAHDTLPLLVQVKGKDGTTILPGKTENFKISNGDILNVTGELEATAPTISENGTYRPSDYGTYNYFSGVTVDVPQGTVTYNATTEELTIEGVDITLE